MPTPSSSARNFDPGAAAAPGSGLFGLGTSPGDAAVHILGVPFDATTSFRPGCAHGPAGILAASHQVDLFDLVTGKPYEHGIWMVPESEQVLAWNDEARTLAQPIIEAGGAVNDELIARASSVDAIQAHLNAWVEERTAEALDAGKIAGVVGGDHSVVYGAIKAHADRHAGLGILHFDAHADLRPAYEGFAWSHASIMHNVCRDLPSIERILQVGVRDLSEEERAAIDGDRIRAVFDHEWSSVRLGGDDVAAFVRREIEHLPQSVYVSFDIDGLDPSLCPNTGTPVPGGLRWDEAMLWLGELVRSGRTLVGFDVNEVAPDPHTASGAGWDEIVGARLLYRLIGFALLSRASRA